MAVSVGDGEPRWKPPGGYAGATRGGGSITLGRLDSLARFPAEGPLRDPRRAAPAHRGRAPRPPVPRLSRRRGRPADPRPAVPRSPERGPCRGERAEPAW